MFETLQALLAYHGPDSKAIVWAHNSHVGDSSATEMEARGEYNIGHLCKEAFGAAMYSIGFGTSSGTVAAASNWDGPLEIKRVRPARAGSYEALCHDAGGAHWLLPLRAPLTSDIVGWLSSPLLERAIDVIYLPETDLQRHYFEAVLPKQFDEYVWFDVTSAVSPLVTRALHGVPDTYPFGV
jgi:protein-L-isoaspartate(D-aspartate) O-methyltransferase